MTQFAVYQNTSAAKKLYPYLLDVQSAWTERLATRVVVPLALRSTLPYAPITRLMPEVEVRGRRYVLVTQELAGVPHGVLGEQVAQLGEKRVDIVAALDLLLTGA